MTLRKIAIAATTLVAIWARIPDAHAYSYQYYCNGQGIRWNSVFKMAHDNCSIPAGTDQYTAYYNAGDQWGNIYPIMDHHWAYNNNCTITVGNGVNETALVARSSINGANGLTQCHWFCFSPTNSLWYQECDVKLADDLRYSNQDESFWNWSNSEEGQVAVVHEFGHAIGLGHQAGLDVMNGSAPEPLAGGTGNHAEPFADDANGVRQLYNQNGRWEQNILASAESYSNGAVVANEPQMTFERCRGSALGVT
jgi:hypothetical protein